MAFVSAVAITCQHVLIERDGVSGAAQLPGERGEDSGSVRGKIVDKARDSADQPECRAPRVPKARPGGSAQTT